MFTAHAEDFLTNRVFVLKMGLILLAGVNAGLLHTGALALDARSGTLARCRRRACDSPPRCRS